MFSHNSIPVSYFSLPSNAQINSIRGIINYAQSHTKAHVKLIVLEMLEEPEEMAF